MRLCQYCVGCKNRESRSQKPQKTSFTHPKKLSILSELTKLNFADRVKMPLALTGYFGYNAPNEKIIETHDQGHEAAGKSA